MAMCPVIPIPMSRRPNLVLLVLLVVVGSGCAPSLTPLYRDFEEAPLVSAQQAAAPDSELDRIDRALREVGWTTRPGAVDGILATEPRSFREWGFYTVEVDLEVLLLAGEYVRVLIHPYRRYIVGGRRKIPYLKTGLAEDVMRGLAAAMAAEGLTMVGTATDRDRTAGAR